MRDIKISIEFNLEQLYAIEDMFSILLVSELTPLDKEVLEIVRNKIKTTESMRQIIGGRDEI